MHLFVVLYNSEKSNQGKRFTITKIHTKRKYIEKQLFYKIHKITICTLWQAEITRIQTQSQVYK